MASTGKINGDLLGLYVNGTEIARATNTTWDVSMDTREVTTKDSQGNRELKEGNISGSASGDFIFEEAASYGYDDLLALMLAREAVTLKHTSNVSGDKYQEASAYITSLNKSAGQGDNVTCSVSFELTGTIQTKTLT